MVPGRPGRRALLFAALALTTTLGATTHGQAPPPKNPFLKLVEPWPDARTMRQRKAEEFAALVADLKALDARYGVKSHLVAELQSAPPNNA